jgi:predicted metal-dependent phosphoesterase TrpH
LFTDLHVHTTASDGKYPPSEIVDMAAAKGLKYLGITDHDSTEGLAEALDAARSYPSLTVLPGVEVSTDVSRGEVHILGYFVDYTDEIFQHTLAVLRHSRIDRARRMLAKLADLEVFLPWERVLQMAGDGSVGRPHIAQVMVEHGYVASIEEAFDRYLGRNGPAYAEREKLSPLEAVQFIVGVGGLPVLAHPADIENLEGLLVDLKRVGLVGMEAFYNGYFSEIQEWLAEMAREYGLIVCGGSDFHGIRARDETPLGGVDVPEEAAQALLSLVQERISKEVRP